MSKRRQIGDIVRKKTNAGFIGESLILKILDYGDEEWKKEHPNSSPYMECFGEYRGCKDEECREWITCEIIVDGKLTGNCCYHVSECEMEDLE